MAPDRKPLFLSASENLRYEMELLRAARARRAVERGEHLSVVSTDALIAALAAPGPLCDQPAVQELLRKRGRPNLTLIRGGGEHG